MRSFPKVVGLVTESGSWGVSWGRGSPPGAGLGGCGGLGRAEEGYTLEVDLTLHHTLSTPSSLHCSQTHP